MSNIWIEDGRTEWEWECERYRLNEFSLQGYANDRVPFSSNAMTVLIDVESNNNFVNVKDA